MSDDPLFFEGWHDELDDISSKEDVDFTYLREDFEYKTAEEREYAMTTDDATDMTTDTTAVTEFVSPLTDYLAGYESCDRCGHRGYVAVKHSETAMLLVFCGHHYNSLDFDLLTTGWMIVQDNRHLLVPQSVSE